MKIIRNNSISKIYPLNPAAVDEDLFTDQVSCLISVFSDKDLEDYKKKSYKDKLNYRRGVI